MQVVNAPDAATFLARAASLLADEARHNLILGLAGTLRDKPGLYTKQELWLVEDGDEVVGAALRTLPYNLVLGEGGDEALVLLAHEVGDDSRALSGHCPRSTSSSRSASARTGSPPSRASARGSTRSTRLSRLRVLPVRRGRRPRTTGRCSFAGGASSRTRRSACSRTTRSGTRGASTKLAAAGNGVALWEDGGEPVSVAGYGSPTPTGVRIGPVYTPREHRGRGYASALTAHVSAEQLAAGRSFCFLYTDLANPASNKIYVAIGYRRVCDSIQYEFA